MWNRVAERLDSQFDEAEHNWTCLVPSCDNDRRALKRCAEDVSGVTPADYRRSGQHVGAYVSPFAEMYMRGCDWLQLDMQEVAFRVIRALALQHPDWMFCSYSAAVLHGLEVSWELLHEVHVACKKGSCTRTSGNIVRHVRHGYLIDYPHGVRATNLRETVLGCLCDAPFELALGIADSALRRKRIQRDSLESYFDAFGKSRRGIAHARAVLPYADERAENGGESRARAVMIEEGYPPDELQLTFQDPMESGHLMRVDFAWYREDGTIVLGELDGRIKYEDPEYMNGRDSVSVMMAERERESRLTAYDVHVMRFPYSFIVDRPKLLELLRTYQVPRSEIPVIP